MKYLLYIVALCIGVLLAETQYSEASDDIVWRHDNGRVHYWPIRDGRRTGGIDIHRPVGSEWTIADVGDVNGDGTDDIVWRHRNGRVHYWPMQNGRRTGGTDIHRPVGGEWTIAGVGDVNGDGTDDIVWRHRNGRVHYWPMQDGRRTGGIDIHRPVGGEWTIAGVGDVNGDGTDDIVWRHRNGRVHYWPMQDGRRTGGIDIHRPVGGEWTIAGVGDVNGDGTDDIVWRHSNGRVHYWPMQDGRRTGGIDIHTPVGGEWTLAGVGDVDGGAAPVDRQTCGSVDVMAHISLLNSVVRSASLRIHTFGPRRRDDDGSITWYQNDSSFQIGGTSGSIEVEEIVRGVRDKKYYFNDFNSDSFEIVGPAAAAERRSRTDSIMLRVQFEDEGTELKGMCSRCAEFREDNGARDAEIVSSDGADVPEVDVHITPVIFSGGFSITPTRIDIRMRVDRPGIEGFNTEPTEDLRDGFNTAFSRALTEPLQGLNALLMTQLRNQGIQDGRIVAARFSGSDVEVCSN